MLLEDDDGVIRDQLLDELRSEGRRVLTAAGVSEEAVNFKYGIDARYVGQGNEITVWVGEGQTWETETNLIASKFKEEYRQIYGMEIPDVGIEVVTWRLAASADLLSIEPVSPSSENSIDEAETEKFREVIFERGASPITTAIYQREMLKPGMKFEGPAIVEERETTSVIRPGWTVEVSEDGSLVAEKESK
tara:strand:- start:282 stop:854 length:573 start_codon:yes stop_codon:yes gene_type:complete